MDFFDGKVFRTTDIFLASYLIASSCAKLKRIEALDRRRKTFVLSPIPRGEDIDYYYARSKESKVVARDILDELRNLKSMIMSQNDASTQTKRCRKDC